MIHKLDIEIPEDWYQSEIRCDYKVTQHMKEVWAIQLDMLYQVKRICSKYSLKWWVDGGTMLGAVRHQGFIPWDDDIDIFMPREDYDKLVAVIDKELDDRYFFQNDWNDMVFYCHGKLRRNDTTAILRKDLSAKFEFHQGIFIDIFPFDNVPDNYIEYESFINYLYLLKNEMLFAKNRWWSYERNDKRLYKHCLELRNLYEKNRLMYNSKPCKYAANLGLPTLNKNIKKKKSEYSDTIMMKFEMLEVPVPIGYDSILKRLYGNYMNHVKGTSCHGELIIDVNDSYKNYINQNKYNRKSIRRSK